MQALIPISHLFIKYKTTARLETGKQPAWVRPKIKAQVACIFQNCTITKLASYRDQKKKKDLFAWQKYQVGVSETRDLL